MSAADFGDPEDDAELGDPVEPDWRADPAWRLAQFDADFFRGAVPPTTPPPEAELAQPDTWASLYDGREIVATWCRLGATSADPSTMRVS